ncbi:EamA family transporter [Pseudoduganella plicata]|nr:EamA family transporter [Pseudoduganella plicata]
MVTVGAALFALPLLPLAGTPAADSWPWLGASACLQVIYYLLLAQAYQHGDISKTYPLMRGSAPLIVLLASAPLLGEELSVGQYAAAALIVAGILAMTVRDVASRTATAFAMSNAVIIAAYTIVDGMGVRASGSAAAYTLWLFVLTAAGMLICSIGRRHALLMYAQQHWKAELAGGVGTMASYGLALWAMTFAPVAVVAALRETSIVFAMLIAACFLQERVGRRRTMAAGLIVCGAAAMRLFR